MFMDREVTLEADLEFYTDAAGSLGYGGCFGSAWFVGSWETQQLRLRPIKIFPKRSWYL